MRMHPAKSAHLCALYRLRGAHRDEFEALVAEERVKLGLPAERLRRAATAKCGTRSGYNRHRLNGESACQACKDAASAYERTRRAAKRGDAA